MPLLIADPLPAGVTPELLAEWRETALESLEEAGGWLPPMLNHEQFVALCSAGCWAGDLLMARGESEESLYRVCEAAGQLCAELMVRGNFLPWRAHRILLDAFDAGEPLPLDRRLWSRELDGARLDGTDPDPILRRAGEFLQSCKPERN